VDEEDPHEACPQQRLEPGIEPPQAKPAKNGIASDPAANSGKLRLIRRITGSLARSGQ
jgi:hypothetical protein